MRRSMLVLLMALLTATGATAAEVKILAALALRDALGPIGADFSRNSDHTATIAFSTVGVIRQRLVHERADVVLVTAEAAEEMHRAGQLASVLPVAATRTGVAIRSDATAPALATIEQFRAALLAARSVAYTDPASGGAFGTYLAGELEKLGIAQAVNAKAVLRRGSHEIVAAVANGEAELGVTFISTIVSTPGLKVAGPLPPPLLGIERFSAGILASAMEREAATDFLAALRSPAAAAIWKAAGFETSLTPP